ncbi:MAG: cell division protein FtsZ [Magnetovibrio sp.]|nr:cell division protein FtsZ [Magnetovibrio sp.]
MSINLSVPEDSNTPELKPRLTVIGVGGAGGNAVNNMIRRELEGVDFVVANTDAQSLTQSRADRRIQLGANLTQGLGAGSQPDIGRAAAEEAIDEVLASLNGSHMAFIAAGMGGGTGTGAAPAIARAAKEAGILTVAVVTKPFQFEGSHRMRLAESGIEELEQYVDTLIIIPNQNLFRIATENTTFADAFAMADEVLYSGVRGVTDLMVMPGLINLDFADIRSVMSEMGKAMMGTGEAEGERRALDAAEAAIANPLLDDTSMKGAKGVLINITGGPDITLFEVDEAASRIRAEVDQDAYIIIGSAFDGELEGKMRVSVVATGIDAAQSTMPQPTMLRVTEAVTPSRPMTPAADETPATPEPAVEPAEAAAPEAAEPEAIDDTPLARLVREAQSAEPAEAAEAPEAPEASDAPADPPAAADEETPTESAVDEEPEATEAAEAPPEKAEPAAPAAMPRAEAGEAFIPPAPKSVEPVTETTEPDAFAAAALKNGAQGPGTPAAEAGTDKPSLFERVTRTGRAAIGRVVSESAGSDPGEIEQAVEDKAVSEESAPAETAAPAAVVASIAPAPEAEPKLTDLAAKPASEAADEEEDLLDIPAFLRRQAN